MKRNSSILYCMITLSVLLFSCTDNDSVSKNNSSDSEVAVQFRMKVPGVNQSATRAVAEDVISNITVLVFENAGTGYEYRYKVAGYNLTTGTTSDYQFYARLSATDQDVKLYILANTPTAANTLLPGATEEEVKEALTGIFTPAGFDGTLPMFGEVELIGGLQDDDEVDAYLVRSVARVDVISTAADFTLTSIQVFRASNAYQIIPDVLINDTIVTSPSIPAGTTQSVNTEQLEVINNVLTEQVYLPESPIPAEADRRLGATVVVIGGIYGTDTDTTYYRIDFVPDDAPELFGQILRNHRYQFNIEDVLSSGWETPGEAAEREPTQIEVSIVAWNESTIYMEFDNVFYFGVSTRNINFSPSSGLRDTVIVQTNVTPYELYWADADGMIDESIPPITLGGTFADPDNVFIVSISEDGTLITVMTNNTNNTGSDITRYLVAVADRLRARITITQRTYRLQGRALKVYTTTTDIGALGNDGTIFGGAVTPGERVRGLVFMLRNLSNFGPDGVIPIERILIAGQAGYIIDASIADLFDVLYLPYPFSPGNTTTVDNIINWHNANDRRVLIVHYDNPTTNRALLQRLLPGVVVTERAQTPPYTMYEDPPETIMKGPFGDVDPQMTYQSFDETHGEISLDFALEHGISPILMSNYDPERMVLGIDFERRIVYSGDIDFYNNQRKGDRLGYYLNFTNNTTPIGDNQAAILMANLWAWIVSVCLVE